MQWNGENLAVSNNDQFAIIVTAVLGLIWNKRRENFLGENKSNAIKENFKIAFDGKREKKGRKTRCDERRRLRFGLLPITSFTKSFSSSWDFTLHLIRKRLNNRETSIIGCEEKANRWRKFFSVAIVIVDPKQSRERITQVFVLCVFPIKSTLHLSHFFLSQ